MESSTRKIRFPANTSLSGVYLVAAFAAFGYYTKDWEVGMPLDARDDLGVGSTRCAVCVAQTTSDPGSSS